MGREGAQSRTIKFISRSTKKGKGVKAGLLGHFHEDVKRWNLHLTGGFFK